MSSPAGNLLEVERPAGAPAPARALILGIGNILLGDEGAGVRALEKLQQRQLPAHVALKDGGTAGLDLAFTLEGYDRVVILDAVLFPGEPGEVRAFRPEELRHQRWRLACSGHGVGLAEALETAALLGPLPEIHIVGVRPQSMAQGTELTPAVDQALTTAGELALKLAAKPLGNLATPRFGADMGEAHGTFDPV